MLQLTIQQDELWDEKTQMFITVKAQTLQLEHSLVSLSKWESKWKKPFFSRKEKTKEELLDYIRCMTITQNVDPSVYIALTSEHIDKIKEYIDDPMTATTITEDKTKPPNREVITSELIYYWMVSFNIPFECQKWHINRLITLIQVCGVKNQPPKKMGKKAIASRNHSLNAARRKQLNTKG